MARVYVKRMLPAEKEQRSHVLLEGVTTESSCTDDTANGTMMEEEENINVDSDTLKNIMNLEGVTIAETTTEEPSYVVVKRTSVPNGDQRDINYNDDVGAAVQGQDDEYQGVMHHVKRKLSNNVEHYSNLLQDLAFPVIFRRRERKDSGRQGNHKRRPQSDFITTATHLNHGDKKQLSLEDFELVENIELHHLDGFIFSSQKEKGRGHAFECLQLSTPSWCDKCGDFIWGVYKQCLQCKYCQYTCHHKCRQLVTLDCTSLSDDAKKKQAGKTETTSLSEKKSKVDDADSGYHTGESTVQAAPVAVPRAPSERTLTREDLRRRIEAFNKNQHGLLMTLQEDTLTFQGFIRVHMNLMRPISMTLPMRPPSIYDVISSDGETSDDGEGEEDTLTTSFYLPKDTTKVIHITRETTTSEVIKALLQKFKITDNPRKFALYEKILEGERSIMRRMTEDERPLPLCLSWSCEGLETRKFILQENDTGEIIWDEFSIPELENFLRILDREEEEYVEQVKARYALLKIQMQKEMQAIEEEEREKELFDKPEDKPPDPSNKGNNSDKTLKEDKREPIFV